MGSIGLNSPQLSLDLKPTEMPKSLNAFLKEISMIGNDSEKKLKVVEYVAGLEEEMKKIEVFKRELPLCMLLLKDAIETLKEEMKQCKTSLEEIQPVMEEFIPPKSKLEEAILDKEKKNWMSSAQLWSSNGYPDSDTPTHCDKKQNSSEIKERVEEDRPSAAKNPLEPAYKFWNGVGPQAFLPFKGSAGTFVTTKKKEDKEIQSVPGLSLVIPGIKTHGVIEPSLNSKSKSSSMNQEQSNSHMYSQQQQAQRKQRRCWSPELHRRFVGALQQLGGSQAATPKQIRELMKVDGLTNDEVKSHLQKYRLHTRRLPNGSAGANQSVCVLGGLWVPQDSQYETSKSKTTSPDGPLQLGSGTAGNSMEDDEDAKSETYSWNHSHKSVESAA